MRSILCRHCGVANIRRCQKGYPWVGISVTESLVRITPKQTIQVYVTKTGKIRIHDNDGEWFRLPKD